MLSGPTGDAQEPKPTDPHSASATQKPLSGNPALDPAWQSWMTVPAAVGAALVAVIIALVVLPVGPDVDSAAMEASVLSEIQRDAPPSAGATGVKSFGCNHQLLSTKGWTCELRQDISLLPDVTVTYRINVGENRCWTGTSDGGSNPSDELLPKSVHACIGSAEPKLRPGLLLYKSYAECMQAEHDDNYCRE